MGSRASLGRGEADAQSLYRAWLKLQSAVQNNILMKQQWFRWRSKWWHTHTPCSRTRVSVCVVHVAWKTVSQQNYSRLCSPVTVSHTGNEDCILTTLTDNWVAHILNRNDALAVKLFRRPRQFPSVLCLIFCFVMQILTCITIRLEENMHCGEACITVCAKQKDLN